MSQPKVYEFAKEIGIETLALMDKIRKWDIPVKSHMAELSPELLDEIKVKLADETKNKKKKTKKKATKKKAATKKTAVKKTAVKKTATKKATKKKTAAKKATTKKASSDDTAEKVVAARKTVIRRKKADEEVEKPVEVVAAVETPAAPVTEQQPAAAEPAAVAAPAETPSSSVEAPATAAAATPAEEKPKVVTAPSARKREVKMTEGGPVSGVKSERPRRNIVGKMDLSKVDKPASAGGQRPQKTSTRNLRTGFVASTSSSPLQNTPQESDRFQNRKDKEKRKKMVQVPAPASKDKDQPPPSFVSSEFRKREVVFQPKKKKIATNVADFKKTEITMPAAHKRVVKVYGSMSAGDLANELGVRGGALIKVLMKNGLTGNINTELDFDTISLIVPEFNFEAENIQKSDDEMVASAAFGDLDAEKITRTPVVTVMGHVDHGKTTLLDTIRKAKVVDGEAGGITQHVGAYRVKTKIGECTFIDTPGHEAFTAMRARGANSTDIVILVVAADDGAMPQTIEAVNHSKAAGVPLIVAVNKMDRPDANPDKVKQQLAELELVPEDWGGETIYVPVSALKGDGIDDLLEQVSLLAEVLELKGNPERSATGIVVESRVAKGKGNVATLLIKDGTLKAGQSCVIGEVACRVRQLFDETGKVIKSAGPSFPVEVIGLPETPKAGDTFDACTDERAAEKIAGQRREARLKEEIASESGPVSLDDLFSKVRTGEMKELPVVLKTDVAGTGEAIKGLFSKVSTEEVKIKVIHSAVGGISESDVLLASTAKGMIVGFNTRPDSAASRKAREKGVEIKSYSIVYELMDEMKAAMSGLLDPDIIEKSLGRVEVRDTFSVPKAGMVAGCFVTEGKISRNSLLRLVRNGKVVYTGKLSSLKRFKDDVKEVQTGFECGLGIENFNDIKVGDEIEAFIKEEVAREL